ncbi:hypothetical protein BC826DRAFT_723955 [Russula brevipes]|nr:hypothetical protein BC826DRAFT_723955 [Russula brevipes]
MGRPQLINHRCPLPTPSPFRIRFSSCLPNLLLLYIHLKLFSLGPSPLSTSFSFFFLLSPPHRPPMSYLANPPRTYHSPDPSTYSHSQLPVQNVRNIANMAPFDSLSAQHSAQSPDHRLPKVGETRCCQLYPYYFTFLHDRSFIVYIIPPAFFAPSSAS